MCLLAAATRWRLGANRAPAEQRRGSRRQKRAEVNMAEEKSMAVLEFVGKAELLKQGAEARVYRAHFLGKPTIVKQRFPKRYRHPTLDEKLTHRRTTQEVRSILRCRKAGKCHSSCGSVRNRVVDIV